MKSRLSGLMDGEIEAQEAAAVLDAVKGDAELRASWQRYQLIGDALKGERALDRDLTARVMAALRDEPVVLAPRRIEPRSWQRAILAAAATVAGVSLVSWVALGPQSDVKPAGEFVAANQAPSAAQPSVAQPVANDMRDYLVAHQAQASSLQFRGGAENIRTVAASGSAFAR